MKYKIIRTDKADCQIKRIILFIAENFGDDIAEEKISAIEKSILSPSDNPYLGMIPKYSVLEKRGYRVLIIEKNLIFYKIDENQNLVTIYAVFDQRQDWLNTIKDI